MPRIDGRSPSSLRPLTITVGNMTYAEGSCQIEFGDTKVICTASVEDRVPPHLRNSGTGWVTAEYSMLPRSCRQRTQRDSSRNSPNGRSLEIQRLIGRSLRSVVNLDLLGERTITIDCDVIQADGGTRTASISGGFIALAQALSALKKRKLLKHPVLLDQVAAISVGIVGGTDMLDLCYDEDSTAQVDMNVIMTAKNKIVEVQGTAEGLPFSRERLNSLLDLAQGGIADIIEAQNNALKEALNS